LGRLPKDRRFGDRPYEQLAASFAVKYKNTVEWGKNTTPRW